MKDIMRDQRGQSIVEYAAIIAVLTLLVTLGARFYRNLRYGAFQQHYNQTSARIISGGTNVPQWASTVAMEQEMEEAFKRYQEKCDGRRTQHEEAVEAYRKEIEKRADKIEEGYEDYEYDEDEMKRKLKELAAEAETHLKGMADALKTDLDTYYEEYLKELEAISDKYECSP